MINCDNCEFIFDRKDYLDHDCNFHYKIRQAEVYLYLATILWQAVAIGLVKGVTVPECGIIGGLRNFAVVLLINLVLAFWGVCMWVNYRTTQPAAKDLSKVNTE